MAAALPIRDDTVRFRLVWADNLAEEIDLIKRTLSRFPYVAMATYPGVAGELPQASVAADRQYDLLKDSINNSKMTQLGLTLFDENGELPTCGTGEYCVWQFNFCKLDQKPPTPWLTLLWNILTCMKEEEEPIDLGNFIQLFGTSTVLRNENAKCIAFHGGFEFGYLSKIFGGNLPETRNEFLNMVKANFVNLYDIKHMARHIHIQPASLVDVANRLYVERVGPVHWAGSDSLIIARVYMRLKYNFLGGLEGWNSFKNVLGQLEG